MRTPLPGQAKTVSGHQAGPGAHDEHWRLAYDRDNVSPAVSAQPAAARVADLARVAAEGRGRVREASP